MHNRISKNYLYISLVLFLLPVFAIAEDLSTTCQQISDSQSFCEDKSAGDCRALLEKCAAYYDDQSVQISKDLTKTSKEKNTLQSQISLLKKKITNLEYQINQGTLLVKDLTLQIDDTQRSINKTASEISNFQNQIADILRSIHEEDQKPPIVILMEGNLSDFFENIARLEVLNSELSKILESTSNLKEYLEKQRQKIDAEKGKLQKTVQTQSMQKRENEQNKKQQENYLKLTEAQYQQQLKDKQEADKKAIAIKSRIFELIGVSQAPTFEEAYNIAKYVSSVTGVRASFVMAVLTQESNIGKNVGQCYLKNTKTGDGVKIKTGAFSPRTMNPTRDVSHFLGLIDEINQQNGLIREATSTPVSCVVYYNGKPYGWGGAMGPAQFIPSTWVKIGYGQKVSVITGKVADPWNIKDAFLASALYLKDLGAQKNEFKASMRYYCGGSCSSYDQFYGRNVVKIADQYEADIKAIGG